MEDIQEDTLQHCIALSYNTTSFTNLLTHKQDLIAYTNSGVLLKYPLKEIL
jgi:hypothetical protein